MYVSIADLKDYLSQFDDPEETAVFIDEDDVEDPGEFILLRSALDEILESKMDLTN